jgi:hypothetical protein
MSGHPEVTLGKVKETLKDPEKVIQSKSSGSSCLFYSVEIKIRDSESLFFCVVVGVMKSGVGRMITAYDTDFMKSGKELYSRKVRNES